MKVRTDSLIGDALNWAVLQAQGGVATTKTRPYLPATNWQHGGPIIEFEMIELVPQEPASWDAYMTDDDPPVEGPTPLIAAMRCFVTYKLGEVIDVPDRMVK